MKIPEMKEALLAGLVLDSITDEEQKHELRMYLREHRSEIPRYEAMGIEFDADEFDDDRPPRNFGEKSARERWIPELGQFKPYTPKPGEPYYEEYAQAEELLTLEQLCDKYGVGEQAMKSRLTRLRVNPEEWRKFSDRLIPVPMYCAAEVEQAFWYDNNKVPDE
jgi:hypothetical protein